MRIKVGAFLGNLQDSPWKEARTKEGQARDQKHAAMS